MDLFARNPKTGEKQAKEAWKGAGYEGNISSSTFYSTKADFTKKSVGKSGASGGLAGISRSRATAERKAGKGSTSKSNGREGIEEREASSRAPRTEVQVQILEEVEAGIDELIFKLKSSGGSPEVMEALRKARRMLYSSLYH
jgi:hypothetical protein